MCLYGDLVVATGAAHSSCGERRSQQLGLLCDVACAAPVVRALVTLPLQAWSLLRSSSHLSWAIVPYSGATIFLRRYCTSQPQFASRELQIVRDPTRRNIACSSHPRTRQCNALKWLCRETTPKGACEGHDHYPEVGTSIRKRLCHSQDHFVRRFMFTPVSEHPQGY